MKHISPHELVDSITKKINNIVFCYAILLFLFPDNNLKLHFRIMNSFDSKNEKRTWKISWF